MSTANTGLIILSELYNITPTIRQLSINSGGERKRRGRVGF
jgi:hypothetical protein